MRQTRLAAWRRLGGSVRKARSQFHAKETSSCSLVWHQRSSRHLCYENGYSAASLQKPRINDQRATFASHHLLPRLQSQQATANCLFAVFADYGVFVTFGVLGGTWKEFFSRRVGRSLSLASPLSLMPFSLCPCYRRWIVLGYVFIINQSLFSGEKARRSPTM